jgi:hypothetical protein
VKALCWMALAWAVGPLAHASMLPANDSVLYGRTQAAAGSSSERIELDTPGAGTLSVTLREVPSTTDGSDAFTSLNFFLGNSSTAMSALTPATLGSPGVLSLDLTGATDLSAFVYWQTPTAGLFNLTANFVPTTPVGLPGGGLLLVGALPLLWLLARVNPIHRGVHGTVISAVA